MLTARGRSEDVLKGFESGADDYLAKPFNLAILLARLESLLRRKNWQQVPNRPTTERSGGSSEPSPSTSSSPEPYKFDNKLFDFQTLQLHSGKQTFQLTLMEAELLRYLIGNAGKPVSRKSILQDVWDLHEDTDTRAIDNFIVRLRRYIERDPTKPRHLVTVRSLGYQFVPNPK
jgi:DNA-binding response OmpR family regulator